MAMANWSGDALGTWVTVDDSGGDNIFGSCLELPKSPAGIITHDTFSQANAVAKFKFYVPTGEALINQALIIGLRVGAGSDYDGYYGGLYGVGNQTHIRILQRVSGGLAYTDNLPGFRVDNVISTATEYQIYFVAKGVDLECGILDASGNLLNYESVIGITPSTLLYSSAGKVVLYKTSEPSGGTLRIKDLEVFNADDP